LNYDTSSMSSAPAGISSSANRAALPRAETGETYK
jgi:hypothetical protein